MIISLVLIDVQWDGLKRPRISIFVWRFLPHDAMLARGMLSSRVCPSMRLSHVRWMLCLKTVIFKDPSRDAASAATMETSVVSGETHWQLVVGILHCQLLLLCIYRPVAWPSAVCVVYVT